MRFEEHMNLLSRSHSPRALAPRVIERPINGQWIYYVWTPTWEGPARPDYAAALADLREHVAGVVH